MGHSLGTFWVSIASLYLLLLKMLQQLSGAIANGNLLYASPSFLKNSVPHWKKNDLHELNFTKTYSVRFYET
jgi:hypothetical protein